MKHLVSTGLFTGLLFSFCAASANVTEYKKDLTQLLLGEDTANTEYILKSKPNDLCVKSFKVQIRKDDFDTNVFAHLSTKISAIFAIQDINSNHPVERIFSTAPQDYVYLSNKNVLTIKRRGNKYCSIKDGDNLPGRPIKSHWCGIHFDDLQVERKGEILKVSQPKLIPFNTPTCLYVKKRLAKNGQLNNQYNSFNADINMLNLNPGQ